MPFDFTEDDFAPKSKFDFNEDDFKVSPESGIPKFEPTHIALVPPTEADIKEAEEGRNPLKGIGRGFSTLGKAAVAGVSDVGNVFFRPVTEQMFPEQAEAGPMSAENIRALLASGGQGPLPAEDLRVLPKPAQIAGRAAQGLIETTPKLAGVTALQAGGIPAPVAAGAIFGLTPEGFDVKQAAIAAALPFVGKYSGAMVEALAGKLGVTKDAALNIFNKLGGATGAAGYLKVIDESEIAKLPPEQRNQARIDSWANVASQAALGLMGERETKPATKVAQPKETSASIEQKNAEIYGRMLPQPKPDEGQVPAKEGESRVQPQTEGGIPQKEEVDPFSPEAKEATIKQRISEGIKPENVRITVNKIPEIPKAGFVQIDEIHPEKGNTFSSNPEQLKKLGLDVPSSEELKTLPAGKYTLTEANRLLTEKTKPAPTETVLASQAQTTPTHGLPAGVPDRGPTFASELLEASRQLGALVRSRATLRPGVLGQFVRSKIAGIQQSDRIEVGDIRNQKTVAHEIGHSLDGILWPQINFGDSQASLAARVGTGTGKELNAELTKVSELMRGPMTGSKGHIAYRKRATELIADFVSLYAHDPDRARAMAPKFAKGFEEAVARDKNTEPIVQGIVSGNVIPRPPDPTLKKQLAGITGTPPQPGTTMPGKVPARVDTPVAREYEVQHAAQELVKGEERMFRSKVEGARIFGDKERKLVPDEADRNDAGAFMEGIGNQNLLGDTIDRVRTRMTAAKERFVKDFRFRIELARQELNKYLKGLTDGEYIKFLEDYLPHIYAQTGAKLQGALRAWKNSPHAKQRILPTVKEAVDIGLTPITQDPSVLYEVTEKMNWRVATNKKFLDGIRNDVKTASGNPVVVPHGQGEEGWIHTEHPLLKRVYARGTPSGLMLWEKGADVHPDVWPALRQILEPAPSWTISKAYDQINAFARATRFLGSLMHDFSLYKAAIGSMATLKNPLRGLFRVFEKNPITGEREAFRTTRSLGKEMRQNEEIMTQAALDGLQFSDRPSQAFEESAHSALEGLAKKAQNVPILGKATKALATLQEWRRKNLWENTHDALKIVAHNDIINRVLEKAPPGTDVKATRDKIASVLNDSFGGQEWQTHFWSSPTVRKYMSRFMLAPDWTISVLRSVPFVSDAATLLRSKVLERLSGRGPAPAELEGGLGNKLRARILGVELGVLAISAASIQYAIYKAFGDDKKGDKPFMWDNELDHKGRIDVTPIMRKLPWHNPKDPTRQYVNLGKREGEIVRWFTRPDQEIIGKLSTPAAIVYEQVSGMEGDFKAPWKQDHESFIESLPQRTVALGKQALPFTFQGNQFALSVPMQKGMTKYKAQQAYESVFELAAQPNRLRSLLRGQKSSEGTLAEMASQITDAAKRNGVPAEEVLKRSLSIVRGHHYNEFFKAFEKGDSKKMDEEARAIVILGGTTKTIEDSIKRRMLVEPVPVD